MHRVPLSHLAVYMLLAMFLAVFAWCLRPQIAYTACFYMYYWISPRHHLVAAQELQCLT